MPQPLNKANLKSLHDPIAAELRQNTKLLIRDQRDSLRPVQKDLQGLRDQLREVTAKLDAIMTGDVLVTRSQLLRVLEQLRAQGVAVEEREIFTT